MGSHIWTPDWHVGLFSKDVEHPGGKDLVAGERHGHRPWGFIALPHFLSSCLLSISWMWIQYGQSAFCSCHHTILAYCCVFLVMMDTIHPELWAERNPSLLRWSCIPNSSREITRTMLLTSVYVCTCLWECTHVRVWVYTHTYTHTLRHTHCNSWLQGTAADCQSWVFGSLLHHISITAYTHVRFCVQDNCAYPQNLTKQDPKCWPQRRRCFEISLLFTARFWI